MYFNTNVTLTSTDDFLVTIVSYCYLHFIITQSHTGMYVCISFDYACRLLGNVIVLFPND